MPPICGNGSIVDILTRLVVQIAKKGGVVSGIIEVARQAGVSKSTASRALSGHGYVSDDARERVVRAAAALGYVVSTNAASLVTGQTRNVGVITPFINRWFFSEALEGIESALIAAGYDLTLYHLGSDAEQRRRVFEYFLVRKRVDAVIAVGLPLTEHEVKLLHSLKKPIVGIGGPIEGIPTVSIDDAAAARLATDHLIGLGHTRIVHLGGDRDEQESFSVHEKRLEGFRAALGAAGISHERDFTPTPYSITGGFESGLEVLADPHRRPTAIVAGCDEIAIGAILAARQLGIQVPQQLSVVGIDDHDLAGIFGLTTLRQDPNAQGDLAVQLLLSELASPGREAKTRAFRAPVTMRVRSSISAPPPPTA